MDRIEAVEIPVEPAFEPLDILPPLSTDDSEEPAVPEPAVPEPAPVDLPKVEAAVPIPAPEAAAQGSTTDYIDLGSLLLDSETRETGETRYMVETPESTGDEDQDFMELLAQFRSKVSEHLGDEDMESRYDLGLAFKEMGLVDEAISQFQFALRGLDDKLKIYEELGDCFMLKGDYTVALKILKGALRHPDTVPGDLIGVHYKLGRSYEEIGRTMEARDAYERVIALDLGFRDAASRLSRL
jgi:tetratricopeptide (TPR) repeat protein